MANSTSSTETETDSNRQDQEVQHNGKRRTKQGQREGKVEMIKWGLNCYQIQNVLELAHKKPNLYHNANLMALSWRSNKYTECNMIIVSVYLTIY